LCTYPEKGKGSLELEERRGRRRKKRHASQKMSYRGKKKGGRGQNNL